MIAFLLSSPAARAGSYSAPTMGGNGLWSSGYDQPPMPRPYTTSSSGLSGGAGTGDSSGQIGSAGTVTASYTWSTPTPSTDPAPPCIVMQSCRNYWYGTYASPPDSACSDGLGNAETKSSNGQNYQGNSSGTRYKLVPPDASGVVAFNLVGAYSHTPATNLGGYYSAVSYSCTAYPITISLTGTTPDSSGNQNILVGQGCTAVVSGIPSGFTVLYNWSVSGTTYQDWLPTTPAFPNASPPTAANANASYYSPGSGPLTNATAHWYWNDPANKSETVTCTLTLTPPTGQGAAFNLTVTKNVSVQLPGWTASEIGGYMQVNSHCPSYTGNAFYAGPTAAERASGQLGGMNWSANVMSSALFASGTLTLVQLVTPQESYVTNTGVGVPGVTHNDPENGLYGLDTKYPYTWETQGSYQPPLTPVPYTTSDSPFLSALNSIASIGMTHLFVDYLLFLPPGSDSKLVPLGTNSWSTNGNATIPSTNNWSDYATQHGSDTAGTVSPTTSTPFTAGNIFPSWTRINVFPTF